MHNDLTRLEKLAKVEIHLHLDCSLSYKVVSEIRLDISLKKYQSEFVGPPKCKSLSEILSYVTNQVNLMQTEKNLRLVVKDLFDQLQRENVIYTEIRFAPLLHLANGLKPEEVVEIVPALKVNGEFIPNPLVYTDKWVNDRGEIIYGTPKRGEEKEKAKELLKSCEVDLKLLDNAVENLCTKLMYLMPNCLSKTLNSLRKKKLEHWDKNKESNRDWLALNMMTEGKAGFRAFNEGPKGNKGS